MSHLVSMLPAVARLYPHFGLTHDYRRKLTRKVLKMLRQGRHVVVVGGPGMGKSYLVEQIRATEVSASAYDDVAPAMVPTLLSRKSPTLVTTHIAFLEPLRLLDERVFRVPLTTIVPKHLNALGGSRSDWNESRGHPTLAAATSRIARKNASKQLSRAWRPYLASNPKAMNVHQDLLRMGPTVDPVQRYQAVRQSYGCETKRILDWLVCMGMVHRQKYQRGAAGIVPVFDAPTMT